MLKSSVKSLFNLTEKTICEKNMENLKLTLEEGHIDTYFQKIVPMVEKNNEIPLEACELLNRSNSNSGFANPGHFYSFAATHGQIHTVDLYVMELGLERMRKEVLKDNQQPVFVNIHLSTLFSENWPEAQKKLELIDNPVVLEFSEREGLGNYTNQDLSRKVAELRDIGIKLAVDDLGKGYSGLSILALVQPDFVKIDRDLVSFIDEDPYRQHMMKALVNYWQDEDVSIIVEGIERKEEDQFFRDLKTTFGQGYFYHFPEKV